eukprot:TRINITY_DN25023_c0_g1_i1.p1 TRINITY_DN25023_c0_g1~~TRINITY_DN25023_c0_g1_i1.p1  ORF type:complete len:1347 (-),score=453.74 TRINITY_DN25023_c0_g1_i1:75-3920(-)
MSQENQELIKAALMEVRGGELNLKKEKSYHDQGRRLDYGYWLKDNQLLVRGGQDFSKSETVHPSGMKESNQQEAEAGSSYGLKKLLGIGFHRSRCIEVLGKTDGDVGAATELLMAECFDLVLRISESGSASDPEDSNCPGEIVSSDLVSSDGRHNVSDIEGDFIEQRNDEKMALESIYDTAFTEKLLDKVWELRLPLEHLWKYLPGGKMDPKAKKDNEKDPRFDKNVCQFFLNGHCRFGRRCYKKHVQPEGKHKVEDGHLKGEQDEKIFILEIRFPEGNRYPQEPAIVTFCTTLTHFPQSACMKITTRLMEESKVMASDGLPSVFSIVSILESSQELDKIISGPESRLSLPKVLGSDQIVRPARDDSDQRNGAESMMGAKEKEGQMKQKSKEQERKMLEVNRRMRSRYQQNKVSGDVNKMMTVRKSLPAWKEKTRIIDLLRKNQVVVISGMTGCGKSTQVPQFILDDWLCGDNKTEHCSVVCTQPRRISAIGVAGRVAQEREEKTGDVVGYQVRLDVKASEKTRVMFCTTGILLRRLEGDPTLGDVTHVIVDEVHERSEESDFLLMILRDTLPERPDLRVILMSATVNADLFSGYFKGAPVLEIPGRTFPVQQVFLEEILENIPYCLEENSPYARKQERNQGGHGGLDKEVFKGDCRDAYLDQMDGDLLLSGDGVKSAKDKQWDSSCDVKQLYQRYGDWSEQTCKTLALMNWEKINYDLVEAMVVFVADGGTRDCPVPRSGSILVFLPGMQEIMTLYDQLNSHPRLGSRAGKFLLVPLHSSLSSEEQQLVFSKPKGGQRKIVISTNMAETSITIDDCVFVVDVGRMKEKRFDPNKNMESLETVWVSQANALQRKGRAGRVMEGFCFHLYTQFSYDNHMRKDPVPEIQRVPLDKMILRIKILPAFKGRSVKQVLSRIIEPPSVAGVDTACTRLQNVGALFPDNTLTPLGYHLAQLPVDVRIGKLMLYGAVFRCLDAALTIAACLSYRSPFVSPYKEREAANRARSKFSAGNSDQLTAWRAYRAWATAAGAGQQAGWVFSQENFLGQKTLQMISQMKHQFVELLASIGFIPNNPKSRDLDRAARGKGGADAVAVVTGPAINANNDNNRLVSAVLCAALYPNIVKVMTPEAKYKQTAAGAMFKPHEAEDLKFKTSEDGYVNIHPSSITAKVAHFETPYLVFHEKVKTSRVFVREVSMVPMYPMVLFGGTGVDIVMHRGQFVISLEEGWIKFICDTHQIAELLKEMRLELDNLLEDKISSPNTDLMTDPRGSAIIKTIVRLISTE